MCVRSCSVCFSRCRKIRVVYIHDNIKTEENHFPVVPSFALPLLPPPPIHDSLTAPPRAYIHGGSGLPRDRTLQLYNAHFIQYSCCRIALILCVYTHTRKTGAGIHGPYSPLPRLMYVVVAVPPLSRDRFRTGRQKRA